MNKIFGLVFVIWTISATAAALRCYECDDCNTVTSGDLVTCGGNATEPEPEPPNNGTDNNSTAGNTTYLYDLSFNYDEKAENGSHYECVSYSIQYANRTTTTVRGCQGAGVMCVCADLSEDVVTRKLITCQVDGCNGGYALGPHATLAATIAFISWSMVH